MRQPEVIVIAGAPASGKTSLFKMLRIADRDPSAVPASNTNEVNHFISIDEIMDAIELSLGGKLPEEEILNKVIPNYIATVIKTTKADKYYIDGASYEPHLLFNTFTFFNGFTIHAFAEAVNAELPANIAPQYSAIEHYETMRECQIRSYNREDGGCKYDPRFINGANQFITR